MSNISSGNITEPIDSTEATNRKQIRLIVCLALLVVRVREELVWALVSFRNSRHAPAVHISAIVNLAAFTRPQRLCG